MPAGPTSDPSTRFPVGRIISGRYRIERPIARGGMGRVYLATQLPLGRKVAIKILIPQSSDREFRRRFLLEASISARLVHRHIVTVHDYGETEDGDLYMAMEYLDGEPLSKAIQRSVRLAPERASSIAMQICRALRAAHAKGVVHRDLKPSNIMLLREDEEDGADGEFVKVLDFGLVKVFEGEDAAPENVELTRAGTLLGSPKYMAPEQIRSGTIDPRTDIYSLGVILFHMLAGRAPFLGASSVEILNQHLKEPVPTIQSIVGPAVDVPPELEIIVRRAMEKSPSRRYASMDELLGDLKAAHRLITGASHELESVVMESPIEDLTSIAELGRLRTPARSGAATPARSAQATPARSSAATPARSGAATPALTTDPERQTITKTAFQASAPSEPSRARRRPAPAVDFSAEFALAEPMLRGQTHSGTPVAAEMLAPAGTALGRVLVYTLSAAAVVLAGFVSWTLFAPQPAPVPIPIAASAELIEKQPAPDPSLAPVPAHAERVEPKTIEPAEAEDHVEVAPEGPAARPEEGPSTEPRAEGKSSSRGRSRDTRAAHDESSRRSGEDGHSGRSERRERKDRRSSSSKTHAKNVDDPASEKTSERDVDTERSSERTAKKTVVPNVDDIDAARAKQVRVVDKPVSVVD